MGVYKKDGHHMGVGAIYHDSKSYINAHYKWEDLALGVGAWFNENSSNLLLRHVIYPTGARLKWEAMNTKLRFYSFDTSAYFEWDLGKYLAFSYLQEKEGSALLETFSSRTVSSTLDLSNPKAVVPYILKGSGHFSTVSESEGYGAYVQVGTPIQLFGKSLSFSVTKINWYWRKDAVFSLPETTGYFYEFGQSYSRVRRGVDTDVWVYDVSFLYPLKGLTLFSSYSNLNDNGSYSLFVVGIGSHFGLKNTSFFSRLEYDNGDPIRLVVGSKINGGF